MKNINLLDSNKVSSKKTKKQSNRNYDLKKIISKKLKGQKKNIQYLLQDLLLIHSIIII